jgi:NHS family xanthosine MFS transporter
MGIGIFMPALTGIISDRFVNAEKMYGIMHILGASIVLFSLPMVTNPTTFFWVLLLEYDFFICQRYRYQ